jgi:hypothetical protein
MCLLSRYRQPLRLRMLKHVKMCLTLLFPCNQYYFRKLKILIEYFMISSFPETAVMHFQVDGSYFYSRYECTDTLWK